MNEEVKIAGLNILAVLENQKTGAVKVIRGKNIVTNDGDQYYAQMACEETPDVDFDGTGSGLRLGSDTTAPTKSDTDVTTFLSGTDLALDSGYEKTSDDDSDNSGSGVDIATWRYSYGTGEGNQSGIAEGAIVDSRTGPSKALTHFLFSSSFDKTSNDTLKVFVNHEFNGS